MEESDEGKELCQAGDGVPVSRPMQVSESTDIPPILTGLTVSANHLPLSPPC